MKINFHFYLKGVTLSATKVEAANILAGAEYTTH